MPTLHGGARLRSSIKAIWERYRPWFGNDSLSELKCCGEEEVARMAHDAGFTSDEFRALMRRGPRSADLFLCRIAKLGLDRSEVARLEPAVFHDMQRVCTMCERRRKCARDLARDSACAEWKNYCPNADTLEALNALPWASRAEW